MNNRPAWVQPPAPEVSVPAPLALPPVEPRGVLASWGVWAATTTGTVTWWLGAGLLFALDVPPLSAFVAAVGAVLAVGSVATFAPLRDVLDTLKAQSAARWQTIDHRERAFEAQLSAFQRWARRTFRSTQPKEQIRLVRVTDGVGRTTTAPPPVARQDGPLYAATEARARVAQTPQTDERDTTRLPELGGPVVWTPAMARIYQLWSDGVKPSLAACRALGLSRGEWDTAMAALVELGYVTAPEKGKGYEWRV